MAGTLRRLPGTSKLISFGSDLARDDNCCCFPQGPPGTCNKLTYLSPTYTFASFTWLTWDGSSTFSVTGLGTIDAITTAAAGELQYGDVSCVPSARHCCNFLDATTNLATGTGNCTVGTTYPVCSCSTDNCQFGAGMCFFGADCYWTLGFGLGWSLGATRRQSWTIYRSDLKVPKDVTNTYWMSAGMWAMTKYEEIFRKSTDSGATWFTPTDPPCYLGATATLEVSG